MSKYLIFDFDGVIGDTWKQVNLATSKIDGLSLREAEKVNTDYIQKKPDHTRGHSLTEEQLREKFNWILQLGTYVNDAGFKLFNDFVKEVELLDTKYKAIVSSGAQKYVIPALGRTKINPTHILAYENHHSKEEKIESICVDWGVETSEVFYFTDTLADVYELRNLISNDKLIGVAWGYCGKESLLKELDSKYILDVAKDIHKVL